MKLELWPAVLVGTIPLGALFSCLSLAWVVTFRTTKVMNFAIGEFAVLAGYALYQLTSVAGWGWWLAALVTVLGAGACGSATYLVLMRPLAGRPMWTPSALTLGLALVLDAVIAFKWSGKSLVLSSPVQDHTFRLGAGATFTTRGLVAIVACLLTFVGLVAFQRLSRVGLRMSAAAESSLLASQSGININRVFTLGWAISAAVAAIAGISYSLTTVLDPTAVSIGIVALTPALIGGIDSIGGTIIGGYITALVANFTILYFGAPILNAVSSVLLLIVLFVRPYGLFGTPEIVRV